MQLIDFTTNNTSLLGYQLQQLDDSQPKGLCIVSIAATKLNKHRTSIVIVSENLNIKPSTILSTNFMSLMCYTL